MFWQRSEHIKWECALEEGIKTISSFSLILARKKAQL